jgi:AGCS family alanine or glycine:cation symporter
MSAGGWLANLDAAFRAYLVAPLEAVIFFDVAFWDGAPGETDLQVPLVVLWLVVGAIFFTLRFRFVNFRGFRHAIDCVLGRYSKRDETGDISHFQALSAALSGTVGLGNIAGVAVAIGVGGPGAVFWMLVAGFLGMTSKFAEVSLAQMYRRRRSDGRISGGPMHYLHDGLAELGWPRAGRALSVIFALMCIGGSFGGGNMFQANQSYQQMALVFGSVGFPLDALAFGVGLALLTGLVIVGGIQRIGEVASTLVPFMCGLYMLCGGWILLANAAQLPAAFTTILGSAFSLDAGLGGLVGTLVQGFRRAAFSNEAGCGSSAIVHSAARTEEPVREGLVALLEPFVDTLIVCNMTALVVVVTGAWNAPEAGRGIAMTSWAFATVFPWFPYLLAFVAFLFAFSTMISWSYYGEQCWAHLFGTRSILAYQLLFLAFTCMGAVFDAAAVMDFGDMMILGMAFPNLVGVVLLSGRIRAQLDSYFARLHAGAFPRREAAAATPRESVSPA